MISEVIAIGLSLNFIIVLYLCLTAKQFAELTARLKQAVCPSKQKVYLTKGLISQYEIKISALENQPAVSVFCPFGIKDHNPKKTTVGLAAESFVYVKKMITQFTKNVAERNSVAASNKVENCIDSRSEASVMGTSGSLACSQLSYSHSVGPIAGQMRDENPTVPQSDKSRRLGFLSIKHFLKVSQAVGEAERKHGLIKKAQLCSSLSGPKPTVLRSKLAVRLEKKLKTLGSSIELAQNISKEVLISTKLDKLNRISLKKAACRGRYQLSCIPEDANCHN